MSGVEPDYGALAECLEPLGHHDWAKNLLPLIRTRFSKNTHGDFEQWQTILEKIPRVLSNEAELRSTLLQLSPWRKGPFEVGGVTIDAEWRSDRKWARLKGAIEPLNGRLILDVGCGNGYYALQMQNAGARTVIGIDPTLLYVMQFMAINLFVRAQNVFVLPLRLQELPKAAETFDTTFSMGVLYHQRSPIEHLRQLRETLRPGGQLVLETIFVPGDESCAHTPADRYARMRNVWLLPTIPELTTWLKRSGFCDIDIVNTAITSTDEQRSTPWMTFDSLAEALDPDDPSKTVEGWPAPMRVVITATAP